MQNQDLRWWEFYFVRYAIGTVVGALVFFFICNQSVALSQIIFMPWDGKLGTANLLLLGSYGLLYCYVASSPILVTHGTRFIYLDDSSEFKKLRRKNFYWNLGLTLACSFIGLCAWRFLLASVNLPQDYVSGAIMFLCWVLFFLIFWGQVFSLREALRHIDEVYSKYKQLALKRCDEKTDIVTSYRHLREHGNSLLIVMNEFLFGIVIYCLICLPEVFEKDFIHRNVPIDQATLNAYSVLLLIFLTMVWLMPGAMVYYLGQKLESRYLNDPSVPEPSKVDTEFLRSYKLWLAKAPKP